MTVLDKPRRCRVCARPSWLRDEHGAVHLCCSRLPDGATRCSACDASHRAEEQRRKARR